MKKLALFILILFAGCSQQAATSPPIAAATGVNPSKVKWDATEDRISDLEKKVLDLQVANAMREAGEQDADTAHFDPQDEQRYQSVKSAVGQLLVVLEKAEPYLDGYTLTFRIGNPTSGTLRGFKGKVKWGVRSDKILNDLAAMQSKQFEDSTVFAPGSWTYIQVKVAPATAQQIRRIAISIQFSNVALRNP